MAGDSVWRTAREAADRAGVGIKTVYAEIRAGRLRAARVGDRRQYRLLDHWIDEWLTSLAPAEIKR